MYGGCVSRIVTATLHRLSTTVIQTHSHTGMQHVDAKAEKRRLDREYKRRSRQLGRAQTECDRIVSRAATATLLAPLRATRTGSQQDASSSLVHLGDRCIGRLIDGHFYCAAELCGEQSTGRLTSWPWIEIRDVRLVDSQWEFYIVWAPTAGLAWMPTWESEAVQTERQRRHMWRWLGRASRRRPRYSCERHLQLR